MPAPVIAPPVGVLVETSSGTWSLWPDCLCARDLTGLLAPVIAPPVGVLAEASSGAWSWPDCLCTRYLTGLLVAGAQRA